MTTTLSTRIYTVIYIALLVLTAISITVATELHAGRLATVGIALGIAWIKTGLIGWYFMHLKSERPMVWLILFIAISAVIILAIGIIPDLALKYV